MPLDSLAWTDVVSAHRDMRFRIGFHGAKIVEAFGPVECVGKYLDEVLPTPYLGPAVATYWRVVNSKVPIYTVSDMRDPAGRIVHHERLLLPFSLSGGEAERVLASIEAVSPEGFVRAPRSDEIPNPAAGNCALRHDPILECCFPIGWLCRPIFCSIV